MYFIIILSFFVSLFVYYKEKKFLCLMGIKWNSPGIIAFLVYRECCMSHRPLTTEVTKQYKNTNFKFQDYYKTLFKVQDVKRAYIYAQKLIY